MRWQKSCRPAPGKSARFYLYYLAWQVLISLHIRYVVGFGGRLGELIREGQERGEIRAQRNPAGVGRGDPYEISEVLGVDEDKARNTSKRAKQIAAVPESKVHEYLARQKENGEEITRAA